MKFLKFLFVFLFALNFNTIYSQTSNVHKNESKKLYNIARNSMYDLNFKKSVIYAEKSLKLALKANDYDLVARNYNIIGLNYEEFSEPQKAIQFLEKGLVYAEKVKNDTLCSWLCTNIGGIYVYRKVNLQKGVVFYHKALHYTNKLKDPTLITYAQINLAIGYFDSENYPKTLDYIKKFENKVEIIPYEDTKLGAYYLLARYYAFHDKNYPKAEYFYNKTLAKIAKVKNEYQSFNIISVYKGVSEFYDVKGDFEKSLFYLKKHDSLEDLVSEEKKKSMLNKEFQSMKLGKINDRLFKMEYENKINTEKLKRSKFYNFILISGIVLVFIILFLLTRGNRKLKEANAQLQLAKLESEETSKLKNQFISTVSHELRTPLYGIIGLTDIIANENEKLKENKYFTALNYSSNYLLSLINDVLDVYKIEEGKVAVKHETINLVFEIHSILESLQVLSQKNNNKTNVIVWDEVPKFIKTDKLKLSQIIINLLSNAFKFTKNGTITFEVSVEESNLIFKISDTGIGIPAEFLNKIFDKFVQLNRDVEVQQQGTGLGLAIVKKTIEAINGTIQIESTINVGTKVTFQIPLIIDPLEHLVANNIVEKKEFKNLNILVVEDNYINQMVTGKILEKNQMNYKMVENGYLALEEIQKNQFDLILMDINMPGMDGFQTATAIRKVNASIPIIALTASDKLEMEKKILNSDINDLIVKPFNVESFLNTIQTYV